MTASTSGSRGLVIVTGAGRGIGAGIALELARLGFDLALTDLGPPATPGLVEQLCSLGVRARLFVSDLKAIHTHDQLVHDVVDWGGPVTGLVNNAGIGAPARGDLLDVSPQAFDQVLGVNLRGTFFLTQSVARHMVSVSSEAERFIVTVSSVSAEMASIERGEYCISKAGLGMLTKLYALRLATLGIGVFEVRPGVIRTPMTDAVAARYDQRIAEGLVPMGRWGEPADVAQAVAAVASGRLSFATGTVFQVDGALSISRL